jgi:hypothetical protein
LNFAASKLTDEDWVFNQERLNLEASYRYSGERPTEEQLAKEHERLRALAKEVAEKATSTSPREALATTGSRSLAMSAVSSGEQALQTGEIPATGKMGATVTTGDLYGPGRQSSTPRLGHMLSPTESLAVALVMFARSAERDPRGLDQYSIGSVTDMVPDVATALKAYQAAKEVYPATLDEASKAALSEARQSVEVNSEAALESLVTAVSNHDALRDGHQEALRSVDTEISTLRQQDTASKQLDGAMKAASELEQAHAGPKVNIRRPHVTTPDYPAH